MLTLNLVAILGVVAMLCMYRPICNYLRSGSETVTGNRKKNSAVQMEPAQEKTMGIMIVSAILLTGFIIRLIVAAAYKGHDTDMNCFLLWGDMVFNDGLKGFYASDAFTDYPPGYMYILYVIGALRHAMGITWDSALSIVMTKLPAIIADLGTGYLIYRIGMRRFKERGAAFLCAIYVFCPAVFLDSTVWGQTDAVFTFFIVLMCYLIAEEKLIPSYFIFALAILIKPQSLIFTPVLIYGIVDQVFLRDFNWRKFGINLGLGILAILMIGLLMMPYGFSSAFAQYKDTVGSYEYASVNAYNFWTLCGLNWAAQDGIKFGLSYQTWGTISILTTVVVSALINFKCKKDRSKYYFTGAFIVTCVFLFSVRMHERYIFPAMILILLAYVVRPKFETFLLYALMAAGCFYNMAYVLFYFDASNYNSKNPAMFIISALMLAVFGYMVYVIVKYYSRYKEEKVITAKSDKEIGQAQNNNIKQGKKTKGKITPSSVRSRMTKADYVAMLAVTIIYGIVAFVRLGNMDAPQTEYSVVNQGAIILDFGESTAVSKMWDFLGYQNNPKYNVYYTDDQNAGWTPLFTEENQNAWDAGSVFAWNSVDVNVTARYYQIVQTSDTGTDSLMEMVFTDAEGNLLLPVNASDYGNLFDEQDQFTGRATNMNGSYFDEIYHGRTAYEMIHHLYCYENTHPPLGKALIAVGVLIFGMCPFGWRFMGTLFGVLMLPIIYNFAKKFFKETWISTVTTILFAFDFMHFVQTRIATIDVFVTLFIMLSYYFMYCYSRLSFFDTKLSRTFVPLGLCGVVMGLSWASKWTGIYSSAGLALIFFVQMGRRFYEYNYACSDPTGVSGDISHQDIIKTFPKKLLYTILFCCVFFVVIPVIIYTLSYIPFSDGTDRGLIARMLAAQKTMYDYHSTLEATHPYSSTWWQWPIMYRPIWYYSGVVSDTVREGISAFGNPLVWWAGIPAFGYMLYLVLFKRDRKAGFLSIAFLSQYMPWVLVTRCTFIYHFFPGVPFITVMVAYGMYRLVKWKPSLKKWVFVYTGIAVIVFVMFYPVLSGAPTTISYATKWLKWFNSWVLLQTW